MTDKKTWFWHRTDVLLGTRRGFLSVDMNTGELVVDPDDDYYSGRIPAADAELLAHEILDRLNSNRDFQNLVANWVRDTLGGESLFDVHERCMRFGEEAIELIQAAEHVSREEMHKLVDYVYDRPVGIVEQELGGTMITLKALASGLGCNAENELKTELHRILDPEVTKKIQKKQHEKAAAGIGRIWKQKSQK